MTLGNVDRAWTVAASPALVWRTVNCSEVAAFGEVIRNLGRVIAGESEAQRTVTSNAWRLLRAVQNTLYPFSSAFLELKQTGAYIRNLLAETPRCDGWLGELDESIDRLHHLPVNPKMDALQDFWMGIPGEPRVLVWSRPAGGKSPGFPEVDDETLLAPFDGSVTIVDSIRAIDSLRRPPPDAIVLTSPLDLRWVGPEVIWRIMGRGCAQQCLILRYDTEWGSMGSLPIEVSTAEHMIFLGDARRESSLPAIHAVSRPASPPIPPQDESPSFDDLLEDARQRIDAEDDERDAVLLVSTGGKYIFLDRDHAVPVVNNGIGILPVPARDVVAGDWVALHEGTSADQLGDLADEILIRRGDDRAELEGLLSSWKSPLHAAISRFGAEHIAKAMASRGVEVHFSRLALWAGKEVMAPGTKKTFLALLATLRELGFLRSVDKDFDRAAWQAASTLRSANRSAGFRLSSELLQRLVEEKDSGAEMLPGTRISMDGVDRQDAKHLIIVEVEHAQWCEKISATLFGRILTRES